MTREEKKQRWRDRVDAMSREQRVRLAAEFIKVLAVAEAKDFLELQKQPCEEGR